VVGDVWYHRKTEIIEHQWGRTPQEARRRMEKESRKEEEEDSSEIAL
jgi:hypothetical protein